MCTVEGSKSVPVVPRRGRWVGQSNNQATIARVLRPGCMRDDESMTKWSIHFRSIYLSSLSQFSPQNGFFLSQTFVQRT